MQSRQLQPLYRGEPLSLRGGRREPTAPAPQAAGVSLGDGIQPWDFMNPRTVMDLARDPSGTLQGMGLEPKPERDWSGPIADISTEEAVTNPLGAAEELTRARFDELQDRWVPMEREILDELDPIRREFRADDAGRDVEASFERLDGIQSRDLSRRGQTLSARESSALDRRANLAEGLGIASAENLTRRALHDRNTRTLADFGQRGRNIENEAIGELINLGGLQQQREAYNDQAEGALWGNLGGILGGGIGFMLGGPAGAGIGSQLGGFAGSNLGGKW